MNNKPMVCMGTVYCVYLKTKIFNIIALSDGMIDVSGFENFIAYNSINNTCHAHSLKGSIC